MGQPAANAAATVVGTDIHLVLIPTAAGPIPTPVPLPFNGRCTGALVPTVLIGGQPAVVQNTVAGNQPPHLPAPGVGFQIPPTNTGTVLVGSATVQFGGQPAARNADPVTTCNDPVPAPTAQLVAVDPTVLLG